MRFKTLLSAVLIFCFVGCLSDPGDEVINVTKTSGGNAMVSFYDEPTTYSPVVTENVSVKVRDLKWRKSNGIWYGTGGLKPADKEAVEAIEAYMEQ